MTGFQEVFWSGNNLTFLMTGFQGYLWSEVLAFTNHSQKWLTFSWLNLKLMILAISVKLFKGFKQINILMDIV